MFQRWIAVVKKSPSWKAFVWQVPIAIALAGTGLFLLATLGMLATKAGFLGSLDIRQMKILAAVAGGAAFGASYYLATREIRGRLTWLTNHAIWAAQQIRLHGLSTESDAKVVDPSAVPNRWPWGSHHTEMLGHVEAAARKWWANYDPTSPDTAPTNDMVSEWLCAERDVSKDKAKAIASILRADGLRTGPRR